MHYEMMWTVCPQRARRPSFKKEHPDHCMSNAPLGGSVVRLTHFPPTQSSPITGHA